MQESTQKEFIRQRPTIGVLAGWQFYHTATNLSYLEPIFRGMSRAAQDLGCNLMLGCGMGSTASLNDPLRPAWPVQAPDVDFVPIGSWNTDGLIVTNPLHTSDRSQFIQRLIQSGFPVLFVGAGEEGPAIVADNEGGIRQAIDHLIEHGHRKIVFIAGSREDIQGDTGVRLNAYREALEAHDLPVDSRLIVYGRHVYDGGYRAMQEILASGRTFSAVLASNDESAMGAMQALREAGMEIPGDVAVIGFDDRPEGLVQVPALTTIHVPLFDIGYRSVVRMFEYLTGKGTHEATTSVPTRLIVRESCGCDQRREIYEIGQVDSAEQLVQLVSGGIFNQVHSITQRASLSIGQRLVTAYITALEERDDGVFLRELADVLQNATDQESAAPIWHSVVSMLEKGGAALLAERGVDQAGSLGLVEKARHYISNQLTRIHRQYLVDDRMISSRLTRLTAQLLTSLEESQVYASLHEHLPIMGINTALLAFLNPQGKQQRLRCRVRDVLTISPAEISLDARDFPPEGLFSSDEPFFLTLVPMMDRADQIGFAVFGTERLELYGAIVQQLVGALKTVELYRQAMEGRRLAEEANAMKGRFLSTISHELRTPLNLIVGLSGILLRDIDEDVTSLPEQAQRDLERIHAYAQHLGGLIGDVLDLASSDAGRLKLNFEPIDLGQALRMVASSGRQLAIDRGLQWKSSLPETGPWVLGDRTRLRQIALNLINNAIKFTESGSVNLWVEQEQGRVTVYVQDTGVGIPPEEQAVIFDEFYRSERSLTQGFSGLGLGLAISRRLLDLHEGTIGVRSSIKGKPGSTFYFTLPVIDAPLDTGNDAALLEDARPTLLLLTNNWEAGERFRHQMGLHNTRVKMSMLGDESAWRPKPGETIPDGIVLDISDSPDLGWRVFHEIKRNPDTRSMPVMFYTASDEGEAILNFDYLVKPIDQADLTTSIDQHLLIEDGEEDGRTILLVDDDQGTRDLHARIVESHSAANRILMAKDGREALKIMSQERVHLVLLDLQMPDIDGFAVLEAMQSSDALRSIPVIVVTGKALTEEEMDRLNRGVTVVLRKGLFNIEETIDHIGRSLERKKKLSRDAQQLVRTAMVYLHDHYREPITRADIAAQVGITEDYLTYCFRQELGTTPIQYLRRLRVNRARALLKNSDKSVMEIAQDLGFSDSGYFSRVFRRETGLSPEAFRSQ